MKTADSGLQFLSPGEIAVQNQGGRIGSLVEAPEDWLGKRMPWSKNPDAVVKTMADVASSKSGQERLHKYAKAEIANLFVGNLKARPAVFGVRSLKSAEMLKRLQEQIVTINRTERRTAESMPPALPTINGRDSYFFTTVVTELTRPLDEKRKDHIDHQLVEGF